MARGRAITVMPSRGDVVPEWKLLQARWTGRCGSCREVIEAGKYLYWHVDSKEVRCLDHAPEATLVDKITALNELRERSRALTSTPMGKTPSPSSYKKYGKRVPSRGTRLVTKLS